MRRAISSWNKTFTRLGFRRCRKRRHAQNGVSLSLELLESRQLLYGGAIGATLDEQIVVSSGLPSDGQVVPLLATAAPDAAVFDAAKSAEPEFVVSGDSAKFFQVTTTRDSEGQFHAALFVAPGAELADTKYEIEVTLVAGEEVLARQTVRIILPPLPLLDGLNDLRLVRAQATVESPDITRADELIQKLAPDGSFADVNSGQEGSLKDLSGEDLADRKSELSLDRVTELSKWLNDASATPATSADTATRTSLYAGLAAAADDLAARKESLSPDEANRQARELGAAATLLLDQLQADVNSADTDLSTAASAALAKAFAGADIYYGAWTGLGVNSAIAIYKAPETKEVTYQAYYEAGTLAVNESLSIDLGGRTAVIASTVPPQFLLASAAVTYKDAGADATVEIENPNTNYGSSTELHVDVDPNNPEHEAESYLQFALQGSNSAEAYATKATLVLHPSGNGVDSSGTDPVVQASVVADNWSQGTINYNNRPADTSAVHIASGVATDTGPLELDITETYRHAIQLGDMDFNGSQFITYPNQGSYDVYQLGDLTAFEQYVGPGGYLGTYSYNINAYSTFGDDVLYRGDANYDGVVNTDDLKPFMIHQGWNFADIDFDGVGGYYGDWEVLSTYYEDGGGYYAWGDLNLDGWVDSTDSDIMLYESGGFTTYAYGNASPRLSLKLSHDISAADIANGAWMTASFESSESSNNPQIELEFAPELIAKKFEANSSTHQFKLSYSVLNQPVTGNLFVDIYRSPDGVTVDTSDSTTLLMTHELTSSADKTQSPGHVVSFDADLNQLGHDVDEDYYLVAVLRTDGDSVYDNESDTTNNQVNFAGGVFRDAVTGIWQAHGADATDTVTVDSSYILLYGLQLLANISGANDAVAIRTHGGNDTVTVNSAYSYAVQIFGGAGNDTLTGGAGDDLLAGGSGDDTYTYAGGGDFGTDTIREGNGDGSDTISFAGVTVAGENPVGVDLDLQSLDQTVILGSVEDWRLRFEAMFGQDIESIVGTAYADTIRGNQFANDLQGGGDVDVLYGWSGANTLSGGAGSDIIYGGRDVDTISGGAGDDVIFAYEGDDTVHGDDGNDLIYGGDGADALWGGAGDDIIYAGAGCDTTEGEAGNDKLFGDAGDDTLDGGAGNDELEGDGGADSLAGGAGDDTYFITDVAQSLITIDDNSGSNLIDLSRWTHDAGAHLELGRDESQVMSRDVGLPVITLAALDATNIVDAIGSPFGDELIGDENANHLWGGAGDDLIYGVDGDDVLEGGSGNDTLDAGIGSLVTLRGGTGSDRYGVTGAENTLQIDDTGGGEDFIDLSTGWTSGVTVTMQPTEMSVGDVIDSIPRRSGRRRRGRGHHRHALRRHAEGGPGGQHSRGW